MVVGLIPMVVIIAVLEVALVLITVTNHEGQVAAEVVIARVGIRPPELPLHFVLPSKVVTLQSQRLHKSRRL
jgi:hypothetical protein